MATRSTRAQKGVIRVAVVDDHLMVLDGIVAHIGSRKTDIHVVISESTWLGLLSHPAFPVEVVVLDLNLGDGIPIGAKIRALSAAGAKTVVMSRHADPSAVHGALAAGAVAFVPKTEHADELIRAITAASQGTQYLSPVLGGMFAEVPPEQDPGLGRQELRAMVLYASGRSIREVAEEMGTTDETVKSYIKRARRKYRQVGIDVGTKILLRRRGIHEGWLTAD